MTVEGKLARRYIFSQRRHSLLTICSITIAVTMMTMLFVLMQTLFSSQREHILQTEFPHHLVLYSRRCFTQEQLDTLKQQDAVADCGFFDPRDYYSFQKARDGETRYGEGSLANTVYQRYYGWQDWSEEQRQQLGEAGLIASGTPIPDEGAQPVWVDFKFRLKEDDTAQIHALQAAFGEVHGEPVGDNPAGPGTDYNYNYVINQELMMFDMIGTGGKLRMATLFAACYVLVVLLALCLRMVIDTAFEISSRERERQFGVLQSVGATKKQIIRIITQEGITLSAIGIPLGLLLGIGFAYLTYRAVLSTGSVYWAWGSAGLSDVRFCVSWFSIVISALTGLMWVFLSAYATGMRMVKKKTPIEAVRSSQSAVTKVKKHSLSGLLFGWVGSLAARNVRRSKKRYAVTVLSLSVSVTLIATVNYAADSFLKITNSMIDEGTASLVQYDYIIEGHQDEYGVSGAKKLLKKLEDSGYYSHVGMYQANSGRSDLSLVRNPEDVPAAAQDQLTPVKAQEPAEGDEKLKQLGENNDVDYWDFCFLGREDYNALFGGNPQISYDELSKQHGFVYTGGSSIPDESHHVHDGRLTLSVMKLEPLTDERRAELDAEFYQTHEPDEKPHYFEVERLWTPELDAQVRKNPADYYKNRREVYAQDAEYLWLAYTLNIVGAQSLHEGQQDSYYYRGFLSAPLISTLDVYEQDFAPKYESVTASCSFLAGLKDDDCYEASLAFLRSEPQLMLNDGENLFPIRKEVQSTADAIKTAIRMLFILISLIAAVSMINVISTGILNRRAEIAGMRSVGMTKKQLNGLILTECAQFVIGGILGAVIICTAAVYGMRSLAEDIGLPEQIDQYDLSYLKPLPVILIAGGCAFLVAVAAAMLPLKRIKEEPIVDSLRSVD